LRGISKKKNILDGREVEVARARIYSGGDLYVSVKRWSNAGILMGD